MLGFNRVQISIPSPDETVIADLRENAAAGGCSLMEEAPRPLTKAVDVERAGWRARGDALRATIEVAPDAPAETLVRAIRDSRGEP